MFSIVMFCRLPLRAQSRWIGWFVLKHVIDDIRVRPAVGMRELWGKTVSDLGRGRARIKCWLWLTAVVEIKGKDVD